MRFSLLLCQGLNGLFPIPLARLDRSNNGSLVSHADLLAVGAGDSVLLGSTHFLTRCAGSIIVDWSRCGQVFNEYACHRCTLDGQSKLVCTVAHTMKFRNQLSEPIDLCSTTLIEYSKLHPGCAMGSRVAPCLTNQPPWNTVNTATPSWNFNDRTHTGAHPILGGTPAQRPRRPVGHAHGVADTRHGRLIWGARHRFAVLPDVRHPA